MCAAQGAWFQSWEGKNGTIAFFIMVGRGRTQDERLDNFVFGFYYSLQNFMTEGCDLFKKKRSHFRGRRERERGQSLFLARLLASLTHFQYSWSPGSALIELFQPANQVHSRKCPFHPRRVIEKTTSLLFISCQTSQRLYARRFLSLL